MSYFFVFSFLAERGAIFTAKTFKQLNSLDDRGIFCTEVHAKSTLPSAYSSPHVHNNIEIIYSVDADVEIKTDKKIFSISPGELIVISPMEQHSQSIIGSGAYYSIKFLPSILFSSDQTFSEYKFFNRFVSIGEKKRLYSKKELDSADIGATFSDIMHEWSQKTSGYELMIRASILKIFTILARFDETSAVRDRDKFSNDAINNALAYISENSATVTEQDAAEHCGLSLAYFSTLFKNTVGMKFGEYLLHLKIGRAKGLLLTTDKSITYIAYETGFSSSSHFIARFRELEGTTPAKYRRSAQSEGIIGKVKTPAFTVQFADTGKESGHLLVFKYRTNRVDDPPFVPIFLTTRQTFPTSDDLSWTMLQTDEKWHVIIIDMARSKQYVKSFLPSNDGKFYGSHVHFHLFYKIRSPDQYVDLAYVVYAKDIQSAMSIIGAEEDVSLGYFEHDGGSRWVVLPLNISSRTDNGEIPKSFYRNSGGLFSDAGANGISLRKVELLREDGVEFIRIWCP